MDARDPDARDVAAALASPWPTWWVRAPDEDGLLAKLAAAGPCPQADLFEPAEPGEPWTARVVWPDPPDPAALIALGELVAGEAPGLSEWRDRGRVGEERIAVDGLVASCRFDLEQGELLAPDLIRSGPDPLADRLAEGLGAGVRSRLLAVVHRPTGRPGLLAEVEVPDRDPVPERRAVVAALARLVGPASLAPDALWGYDAGRVWALAWRIARGDPRIPEDCPLDGSVHAGPGPVEVQVALPEADHDAAAEALGEAFGALGFAGSRPRWGRVGDRRVFLACWSGEGARAREAADRVGDRPFRVVPGCPEWLEPDWLGVDPAWYPADRRTVVRWRCGLRDQDLLPPVTPRDADALDRALAAELAPLGPCEPVEAEGPALRLVLPALPPAAWTAVVRALGALPVPEIGAVLPAAWSDGPTVLLPRVDLSPTADPR